jgi:hypothetical protein
MNRSPSTIFCMHDSAKLRLSPFSFPFQFSVALSHSYRSWRYGNET